MNAAVSCGPILAAEIGEWWRLPLPDLIVRASPWQIIVGEGLCPVLLLLAPRLGIVWTTLVIGVIGQRGATAFVMLAIALSLSFLRHEDGRRLGEAAKRYWPWIVALTLCLVTVSAKTYVARRPWYEFLYLHVFLLLVAYAGAYLLWRDVREALSRGTLLRNAAEGLRLRAIARRISPGQRAVHAFVAAVWLVATLNGLAPYLGWKYRLSFAMLSNLRVDDARWNSLVFPPWLRTSAHDPYVHIDRMTMDLRAHQVLANLERPQTRALAEGLVSPMSLEYRMRYVRYHALNIDLDLTYRGEHFYFADIADNQEFHQWLDDLPMTLMIQDYLVDVGPQPCIH